MPKLYPTFVTGPDRPLDRPERIFFPATTNDGRTQTVSADQAQFVQATTGTLEGVPVPTITPNRNLQMNRVYCVSRRMFPKAL